MKRKSLAFYHTFISFFSLFALSALLIDSYKYSDSFQKYFFVDSRYVLLLFLLTACYFRLRTDYKFPRLLSFINGYLLFPLLAISTILFSLWDYLTHINFVFERFSINYIQLGFLALGSLAVLYLSLSHAWWKENWKQTLFFSAVVFFLILLVMRMWPFDFFKRLVLEDHFIEWSQFFVILSCSILSGWIAFLLRRNLVIFACLYLLFGLVAFFIAGDEISWGQRIFDFQTPSEIALHNTQQELTVHNISTVSSTLWFGYLLVSFLGSFSWVLLSVLPGRLQFYAKFLLPPWYVSSYFLLSLLYHLFSNPSTPTHIREWSEPAELILYLGVFSFLFTIYITLRKK